MTGTILIRNGRPMGGATADILIEHGRIAAIGARLAAPDGITVEDGGGALALPGLIEGHAHIDKTLWGMGWVPNDVGPTIRDRIDTERRFRAATNHDARAQSERIAQLEATLNAVAERADRAESLALGQNQVLVRFVAAEEKLEIAEQLIVDLSRRVATVEGIDPADREDMDVRLADLDHRMQGLQRDVGMVARMTINGSPAAVGGRSPSGQANFDRANGAPLASPVARPENVPNDVTVGDFVNGYGTVLEIFATSDGGRMVVMENGSVILN